MNFLALRHGIVISLRQLRRILAHHRRRRLNVAVNYEYVLRVLQNELAGSGQNLGYRAMWHRLRTTYSLPVTQEATRILLRGLDPEGVALRSSRRIIRREYICPGPNYLIHIDGYDKLKQFGFAVHAAIDGFSRKILWLYVGKTNNNPQIIAKFFIDFVKRIEGMPRIIRGDRGTENVLVRDIQVALRWHHDDAFRRYKSFLYGRSVANQRIEAWWGQLRRMSANYWMQLFSRMKDNGSFDNSNPIHVDCIRLCFNRLIQRDFDRVVQEWNQHLIRSRRYRNLREIPDVMYFTPEVFQTRDYKMPLNASMEELAEVERQYCSVYPQHNCSPELLAVIHELFGEIGNDQLPDTVEEAIQLYQDIVEFLSD